jgi:hypothetical protein
VTPQRVAPFFCLARAAWIPYALTWKPETGEIRGAEGPRGFDSYRAAVEAGVLVRWGALATEGGLPKYIHGQLARRAGSHPVPGLPRGGGYCVAS